MTHADQDQDQDRIERIVNSAPAPSEELKRRLGELLGGPIGGDSDA